METSRSAQCSTKALVDALVAAGDEDEAGVGREFPHERVVQ